MLQMLSRALRDISGPEIEAENKESSLRVAVAALLVHAGMVDGDCSDVERQKILELLETKFSLSHDECTQLLQQGTEEDRKSVDLYGFTKTLASELDQKGRLHFVKMMWQVILADGQIDDFESHLVWRVADLLGVSTRDRVMLRRQIESDEE